MSRSKNFKQRWLPLALVPLFSVSVLAGCGSDDDDDGDGDTTPDEMVVDGTDDGDGSAVVDPNAVVGDADGSGIADAFEAGDDANGNGIGDIFETAADGSFTDENGNEIDDSYEVALTEGADANQDGVDDAADPNADATGTDGDGGAEPVVVDQTGPLSVPLNDAGVAELNWDGFNLTGQIDIDGLADGVGPARGALFAGIAAAGVGVEIVQFNGDGNPTYFLPNPLGDARAALVAENIKSGNLYVQVDLSDGSSRDGIILLPGVTPKFSALTGDETVPMVEANSNGSGFVNVNTATGDFSAVVNVNLDASDVDADGNPETVSIVHIHEGAVGESGPAFITFLDSGNGTTWVAQGVLTEGQLETVLAGGTYFNVHRTDGSNFIRGQISAF